MKGLTEKQRAWVDYYKQGKTATEAARLAGYRGSNHDVMGAQNVVKLRDYIIDRENVLETPRIADMVEINEFWSEVIRDKDEKMADRIKASELRAKVAGAFIDRVEQSGDMTVKVVLEGEVKELAE